MKLSPRKDLATLIVFVFAFLGVWSTYMYFVEHRRDIILAVDELVTTVAFPYYVLEMKLKREVTALPVPVYGVALEDVEDSWGFGRTEGRTHEGTDIFAPSGTPVFSVTEGYIFDTYFGHRGGNNVMVIGPAGIFYYYAHFERLAHGVERGMYVSPDTVLGYVGSSGNATNTPPHLHFGVYPTTWNPINPFPLISIDRWRRIQIE